MLWQNAFFSQGVMKITLTYSLHVFSKEIWTTQK